MLEGRRADRELEGVAERFVCHQPVDEPRGEGVAAADAVYYVGDFVDAASDEFLAVVQAGGPEAVLGGFGLAEGDRDELHVREVLHYFVAELVVVFGFDEPRLGTAYVCAEGFLEVAGSGYRDVGQSQEVGHDFLGFFCRISRVFRGS